MEGLGGASGAGLPARLPMRQVLDCPAYSQYIPGCFIWVSVKLREGPVGRASACDVPPFSMQQIRPMIALLRPLHHMEDLLQGQGFQGENPLQQAPHL